MASAAPQKCLNSIMDAAPNLSKEEAESVLDEVFDIYENTQLDNNYSITFNERFGSAVNKRVADVEYAAVLAKKQRVLRLQTRLSYITKMINTPVDKLPILLETLIAAEMGVSKYKNSADSSTRSVNHMASVIFLTKVEENGVPREVAIKFLRKKKNSELLFRDSDFKASQENGFNNVKSSDNEISIAVVDAIEATNEFLRKLVNKNGGDVGRIPGYLMKQSHDSRKVAGLSGENKEAWIEFIKPLLDEERTYGAKNLNNDEKYEFLSEAWTSIVYGNTEKSVVDLDAPTAFTGSDNLGKKASHARSLHFKVDGTSSFKYMQAYGMSDVGSSFVNSIDNMSRTIGMMMHLGPNPRAMLLGKGGLLDHTIEYAKTIDKGYKTVTKLTSPKLKVKLENLYDTHLNYNNVIYGHGATYWIGTTSDIIKNLSSAALLGMIPFSSIADLGNASLRLKSIGKPFLESNLAPIQGLLQGRGNKEIREIADSINVGMEGLISGAQSSMLGGDALSGKGSNYVSAVMRYSGMNWWNDSLKTGVGTTLSNFIAKQKNKNFDQLSLDLRNEMLSYGLTSQDFETMKKFVRTTHDGKEYINLKEMENNFDKIRITSFFTGFVDSAILTPNTRSTEFIRGGLERGTFKGEINNLFWHLKSFSVLFGNEVLTRIFGKSNEGKRFGTLVHLLTVSTMYGYLASTLKDIAKNREPQNILDDPLKVMGRSLAQAGGLGFYGDILIGMLTTEQKYGRGIAEMLGGPGLNIIGKTINELSNVYQGAISGDWGDTGQDSFQIAKSLLPGANIWYAKQILDYLVFWQMSEWLNPGWARNYEKRVKEYSGQDYMNFPGTPFVPPTVAVR